MIFKQWEQVLNGTKTQTRRPVKKGEVLRSTLLRREARFTDTVAYEATNRGKWQVGCTYALQPGRGKKAVGRVRITGIRRERLQSIKPEEFRREGLVSGAPIMILFFIELWDGIYRGAYRWDNDPEVWVLDFELMEERS